MATVDLDLAYTSAVELARAIRRGEISPVEAVRNSLARIEAVNPKLNCFCFVYPEEALAKAKEAEDAVMAGRALGPLHGVPIAFKDFTPTKGKRTTLGSYTHENWIPDEDATIVRRLLGAGAIMVGKTATSEFALAGFTETPLWGVTRNPWDTTRTPGGSSGGSGAAVASGCVPLAEGCDMGGSIRIPAALCGIVGLKPSFGRIPFDILPSQFDTYCHFGPLARTIADAAAFLAAAQGADDRDILSLPQAPEIPKPLPDHVEGMTYALSIDLGYYAVDPEVEANTRSAADVLRRLGATVDEVEIGWSRAINDAGWLHWMVYTAAIAAPYLPQWRDRMDPLVVNACEEAQKVSALDLKKTEFVRTEQWRKLAPVFARYDALLCPTMSVPAPPTGTTDLDYGYDDAAGRYHQFEMTFPFNLISPCPALSVPSGFTKAGLPTGLQIVGRRHQDRTVLQTGAALQRALGWTRNRPPVEAQ